MPPVVDDDPAAEFEDADDPFVVDADEPLCAAPDCEAEPEVDDASDEEPLGAVLVEGEDDEDEAPVDGGDPLVDD